MKGESGEPMGMYADDPSVRQQRAGLFLRDAKYRIHADLVFDQSKDPESNYGKYSAMFERRAEKGQCFNQPYLGCREFSCAFRLIAELPPEPLAIRESRPLGWMLYDLDYADAKSPSPRFFNAVMTDGVIDVPAWDSDEVRG